MCKASTGWVFQSGSEDHRFWWYSYWHLTTGEKKRETPDSGTKFLEKYAGEASTRHDLQVSFPRGHRFVWDGNRFPATLRRNGAHQVVRSISKNSSKNIFEGGSFGQRPIRSIMMGEADTISQWHSRFGPAAKSVRPDQIR